MHEKVKFKTGSESKLVPVNLDLFPDVSELLDPTSRLPSLARPAGRGMMRSRILGIPIAGPEQAIGSSNPTIWPAIHALSANVAHSCRTPFFFRPLRPGVNFQRF